MKAASRTQYRWYSLRSLWNSIFIRPRVVGCALTAIAVYLLSGALQPEVVRIVLAWCCGGIVYLVLSFRLMVSFDADTVRARAAKQDDSAVVILALILVALFSALAAIFGLITVAKVAEGSWKLVYVGLTVATIVISWTVMQVAFTFHYAHLFYEPGDETEQGLLFVKTEEPDFWDFFYFATSIGAASQTSDTSIVSRKFRRLVTLHAIVSFFFNTMVLALSINLAASMV